jgi:hypothetical protein
MRSLLKYKHYLITLAVAVGAFVGIALPQVAYAVPSNMTTFAACENITSKNAKQQLNSGELDGTNCFVTKYVNPAIKFMAAVTGVAVVLSIVIGGIQYSAAGGDPSKVAAARNRIQQAIIALLAFLFLLTFLNFIIPGGINGTGG